MKNIISYIKTTLQRLEHRDYVKSKKAFIFCMLDYAKVHGVDLLDSFDDIEFPIETVVRVTADHLKADPCFYVERLVMELYFKDHVWSPNVSAIECRRMLRGSSVRLMRKFLHDSNCHSTKFANECFDYFKEEF